MTGSHVTRRGRILRCAVSTSERGSSLSAAGVREAARALAALDAGVGAVLLVGEGPNFCTGGDVLAFAAADDPGCLLRELAGELHEFVSALVAAPVPVVAAVHGWAAGAGMSLVCASDIAIAGPSTRLRPAYRGIGFSPDGGMAWTLPRIVGAARARHILLADQVLDADQALVLGLVSAVVPDDEVVAEAERIAEALATGPTEALGRTKRLLAEGATRDLAAHLDAETEAIAASAGGAEGREGVAAFRERRTPRFGGES